MQKNRENATTKVSRMTTNSGQPSTSSELDQMLQEVHRLYAEASEAMRKATAAERRYREALLETLGVAPQQKEGQGDE